MVIFKRQPNSAWRELGAFLVMLTALGLSGLLLPELHSAAPPTPSLHTGEPLLSTGAAATDINLTFGLGAWIAVIFQACAIALAASGIGSVAVRFLRAEIGAPFQLAVGSAVLALVSGLLGICGWLRRPDAQLFAQVLVAIFSTQALFSLGAAASAERRAALRCYLLPCAIFAVLLSLKLLLVVHPDMHPDALWYNLTAVRQWFLDGGVRFSPASIASVQSSFWEYLYLWPQLLSGVETPRSPLALHITAQLIHFLLGHCAVFWSVLYLVERALRADRVTATAERGAVLLLAGLAVLVSRELFYTAFTAKNDWGIASWWLAGAIVLLCGKSNRETLLAGLLAGVACGGKFSYFIPTAALAVVWAVRRLQTTGRVSRLFWWGIGWALPVSAVLLRNFWWTGDPFFPALATLFPDSAVPPVWRRALAAFQGHAAPWRSGVLEGFFPLTQLLALVALVSPRLRTFQMRQQTVTLGVPGLRPVVVAAAALFLLNSSVRTEARLIGVIPLLLLVLGSVTAAIWLFQRPIPRSLRLMLVAGLAISLVISAEFDRSRIAALVEGESAGSAVTSAPGGLTYEFLAARLEHEKLFVLHNTELFYLLPWRVSRVWDDLTLESTQRDPISASDLLCELSAKGRWLLITPRVIDNFFDGKAVEDLIELVLAVPGVTVATRPGERLVDLQVVAAALRNCR